MPGFIGDVDSHAALASPRQSVLRQLRHLSGHQVTCLFFQVTSYFYSVNTGTIPHFDTEKKLDIWDKTCILHQTKLNLVEHYVFNMRVFILIQL